MTLTPQGSWHIKRMLFALLLAAAGVSVAAAAAPGPPQTLVATVSGNTVTLTWSPSSTGGVPSSYLVQVALVAGGAAVTSLPVPASPLVVPNVPNGVYFVRVVALNVDGASPPSTEVTVAVPGSGPPPCSSPPNPPHTLTGSVTGNLVTLSWSPSAVGCPATAYAVHVGSIFGASDIASAHVGAATSLVAAGPPGSYYLRVVATNAFGASAASNEVLVTVGTACQPPLLSPDLLTPTAAGSNLLLSWRPGGGSVTGYILEAGSSSGAVNLLNLLLPGTSYTWINAPLGVHYLRVRPLNTCGTGTPSPEVIATVTPPPPPPAPNPPAPTLIALRVDVYAESGECIPGAKVEIVAGQAIGESGTTPTACFGFWDAGPPAIVFWPLVNGREVTLRASAPGYLAQEITVVPTALDGAVDITLRRIPTP